MSNIPKRKDKKGGSPLSALGLVSQLGLSMVVAIGGSLLVGKLLDGFLGTGPWLMLVFTVLGVLAAFRNLFYMTKK